MSLSRLPTSVWTLQWHQVKTAASSWTASDFTFQFKCRWQNKRTIAEQPRHTEEELQPWSLHVTQQPACSLSADNWPGNRRCGGGDRKQQLQVSWALQHEREPSAKKTIYQPSPGEPSYILEECFCFDKLPRDHHNNIYCMYWRGFQQRQPNTHNKPISPSTAIWLIK